MDSPGKDCKNKHEEPQQALGPKAWWRRGRMRSKKHSTDPWAGNLGEYFTSPQILSARVGGCDYLFSSSGLLDGVSFNKRRCMSLQHDGAPLHYSHEVRQWLSENYSRRWIARGRKAPVSWPACSPLDCLWKYLKTKIYPSTVDNRKGMWYRFQ
jgi:hypothetical protein